MTEAAVMRLATELFEVAIKVASPVLIVAVVVGVMVSIGQVLTSIQDATLAFVIRLGAVGLALAVAGRWMLHVLTAYTIDLWNQIPAIVGAS